MIKQDSIDEVRQAADIIDVVGRVVKLKRSGSNHTGLCPFHDERTPSFIVSPAKQMYKCFGCGKSGDAFRFVMEYDRKSFIEAVEQLAADHHITLVYDQQQQQISEDEKNLKQEMYAAVEFAYKKYQQAFRELPDNAPLLRYLQERGFDKKRSEAAGFGFAPADFKFITGPIINAGKHKAAAECGIITTKEGISKDFLFNRLILPIHDQNGILTGLAGRTIPTGDAEEDKKYAKYLNPPESLIYNKKKIWYGLLVAQKAIREKRSVYIAEGYMDVIAMHAAGILNTVAACGTEIDPLQAKFLKRYSDHAIICFDGDKTGQQKTLKVIDTFLKQDFKVSVAEIPDRMDPDEYLRSIFVNIYKSEEELV